MVALLGWVTAAQASSQSIGRQQPVLGGGRHPLHHTLGHYTPLHHTLVTTLDTTFNTLYTLYTTQCSTPHTLEKTIDGAGHKPPRRCCSKKKQSRHSVEHTRSTHAHITLGHCDIFSSLLCIHTRSKKAPNCRWFCSRRRPFLRLTLPGPVHILTHLHQA